VRATRPKHVIHVSDAEAGSDFAASLERVSAGAEVIIERDSRPVAVVRAAEAPRGRLLSESIALAEAHATELGNEPTLDAEFAVDLKQPKTARPLRILTLASSPVPAILVPKRWGNRMTKLERYGNFKLWKPCA
jgi:antitoxin (DNA-binding transcriptional repressor) of toxin-antitoxin stability system